MNKVLFVTVMLVANIVTTANAQNIVGKWQCSKEFVESLKLDYWELQGCCKFRKNGTFKAKLQRRRFSSSKNSSGSYRNRMVSIRINGRYSVENGTISTTVSQDDISCYVEPHTNANPYIDKLPEETGNMRMQLRRENRYDYEMSITDRISDNIKAGVVEGWNWQGEPVTVTESSLTVNGKALFSK